MTTPRVRVHEFVADILKEAGVECIFGVMGEDTAPLMVSAAARGIRCEAARHENQAVAMADGYSRATGRTGYATVTGGPGFTNALTAINTAYRANSRVVVIVGAGRPGEDDHAEGTIRKATGASWLKHFPQSRTLEMMGVPVFRPLAGNAAAAETQGAIGAGRYGTAVVVFGRQLLLEQVDAAAASAPAIAPAAALPAPDPEAIATVGELLGENWAINRPVILAGRGALRSGAGPALKRLGELTGALLATTLPATTLFEGDPYNIGICGTYATAVASDLITQADCVLAFGAGMNVWTTYNNSLFPRAHVIQVDARKEALGQMVDIDLGIVGDARAVAEAMVAELERRGHSAGGFRTPEVRASIADFRPEADVVERSTADRIDPRCMMLELNRLLPAGRILCVDGGQHGRFAVRYVRTAKPGNFVQAVDAGSIGLSMGTGVGAAYGRPGEPVMVAVGDAGMMMSLGDLETAVRLRLPILVVVSNDAALGAEVNVLSDLGMDTAQAQIASPSFEAIARAMGAQAATIRSVADLAVVTRWLESRPNVPLVLDCMVNSEIRAR